MQRLNPQLWRASAWNIDLDLWFVDLDRRALPGDYALLSAEEQHRASRFVFERDRRRFVSAHAALRCILADRLHCTPASLCFSFGAEGKPGIEGCAFNLSHSGGGALITVGDAGEHLGVDCEQLRAMPDADLLAETCLHPQEHAAWSTVAPLERATTFLTAWTRKEACLKAVGVGLTQPTNTLITGLWTDAVQLRIATAAGAQDVDVHSFQFDGYVASLARVTHAAATCSRISKRAGLVA